MSTNSLPHSSPQTTKQNIAKSGLRVALDPISSVIVMENHDQAYHVWHKAEVKDRVLIHIDAHHDMWWIPEKGKLHVANFVCLALRENLLSEVYWVVPDRALETARNRKAILGHLRKLDQAYPGPHASPKVGSEQLVAELLGKRLTICSLNSLPQIEATVLLDIDIDFFVIPRVFYGEHDRQEAIPWCWPEDLLERLSACNIRTDMVTIAYSVEGGYTPLKWKYLGEELKLRLRQPREGDPAVRAFELMRVAAERRRHGDPSEVEKQYRQVTELLPSASAPYYHLAEYYLDTGRATEAQTLFQRLLSLDPSYRTPYNSKGIEYLEEGRLNQAEEVHRRTLILDPGDPYAFLGLGQIEIRRKHWKEAELLLRNSLMLADTLPDTYRYLGEVLSQQRRTTEAIAAYTRSLKLVLSGHKCLARPIATEKGHSLQDPNHLRVHFELARLYDSQGDISQAIQGYRLSLGGGYESFTGRIRLAQLYLGQLKWQQAASEVWRAMPLALSSLSSPVRNGFRRVRRAILKVAAASDRP